MNQLLLWIASTQKKLRPVGSMVLKKQDKFLLVKKPRTENAWQFPQGGLEAGETFYQGAIRELKEECGATLEVESDQKPLTRYRYFFPKNFHRNSHKFSGAEVVFFTAKYISGTIELDKNELEDFVWADKKEIQKKVTKKYWNIIRNIL